jgi:hypothetical protein
MSDIVNPLLQKIKMPGKRFRLPSRGQFYVNGELDENVKDGEIEIFSMTAIDEISLRSPEFLFTGAAIERVFKRCIPEIKKPLQLLSKDVDFILAALRVVSYGGSYQITDRCDKCEAKQVEKNNKTFDDFLDEVRLKAEAQHVDFELAMQDERVQKKIKVIMGKKSPEHTYTIDLAGILQNNTNEISPEMFTAYDLLLSNGQVLSLLPYRMDVSVAALQFQNDAKSINLDNLEEFASFLLAAQISKIDDIVDQEMINGWVTVLPRAFKEEIDDRLVSMVDWGTDFTYTVVCKNSTCGHTNDVTTLLNPITFFMKPSK